MFKSFFNKFKKGPTKKFPRDPVCGMHASDGIVYTYKEQTYAFCSDHCRSQFEKNPRAYIAQ